MGSYRRLKVWREAHALGCDVYRIARELPPVDRYCLGDQLRRAGISIGANIAEGCGRNGDKELSRFLNIALGSANELQNLLQLARDVEAVPAPVAAELIARAAAVCRMLAALHATTSGRQSGAKRKGPGIAGPLRSS